MKRLGFLLLLLLFYCAGTGQKIQYSRQLVSTPRVDAMQLVTNLHGNHHLVTFRLGKKPKAFVFNRQLQLTAEIEMDVKLKPNHEVRIIPFTGYYLLQLSVPKTTSKTLMKISAEGEVEDITESFSRMLDSAGINGSATAQLMNQNNALYLLSMIYSDGVKQVFAKILQLSPDMKIMERKEASFPFDAASESLHQTMVTPKQFMILKTARSEEKGHLLELSKINLTTGDIVFNTFTTASHSYSNPAFQYFEKDSTFLVYSLIREPVSSPRLDRSVLVAKLNHLLEPTTPLNLLKSQFRNNARVNFLLLKAERPFWATLGNGLFSGRGLSVTSVPSVGNSFNSRGVGIAPGTYMGGRYAQQLPSVRLTVLNEQLQPSGDSLVESNKLYYELQPSPFGQCTVDGNAYLVLIQNFTENKRGLMMVHSNEDGGLVTTPLPVYDRYEYNPSLLETGNDYFILPYTHKNETGLVKITLKD